MPKQAAYIHVWAIKPLTKEKLHITFPIALFDLGCELIGAFVDDMAANPTMVSGTENINYPALSKACKGRIKQQGAMTKAVKADQSRSAVVKPKPASAPSHSVPSKPETVSGAKPEQKADRQAARKEARQEARKQKQQNN